MGKGFQLFVTCKPTCGVDVRKVPVGVSNSWSSGQGSGPLVVIMLCSWHLIYSAVGTISIFRSAQCPFVKTLKPDGAWRWDILRQDTCKEGWIGRVIGADLLPTPSPPLQCSVPIISLCGLQAKVALYLCWTFH